MKKDGPEKTRRSSIATVCIIRTMARFPYNGAPFFINPTNTPFITWIYYWVPNSIQTPFLKGLQQGALSNLNSRPGPPSQGYHPSTTNQIWWKLRAMKAAWMDWMFFFWERQLFLVGILFHQPFQGTKHFNGWLDLNREILRCWVKKSNKKPTPQRSLEYSPNNSELIWIADLFWRSEGWEVGGGFLSGFDEEVTCYVRWLSTLDSKHQHRTAGFSPSNLNRCR